MSSRSPKDYWRYLNNIATKKSITCPDISDFYKYFNDLNNDHTECMDPQNGEQTTNNLTFSTDILNNPITQDEIEKNIRSCKNGKAPSQQDFIINEYLKNTKTQMIPLYTSLFNMILDSGILPDTWLVGEIKPIYKNKGSPNNPENYRPITILSCLGKVFTAILNDRIHRFLEENNLLNENQAGFRSQYSTCDHIFTLYFIIEKLRTNKKKLFCSFIDFSKAFDSVWRAGLWTKLLNTGICGKILKIIQNMYSNIKSCICNDGNTSAFFSSQCGVRQGENLSPVLFSLYLNDLENYLSQSCDGVSIRFDDNDTVRFLKILILLYADDTVVISDNESSFQTSLDNFYSYCQTWKLKINFDKTKVIIFGARNPGRYVFKINGKQIECVKEYKYLGTYFSSSGSFLKCRKHIVEQANKAMYLLFRRINNLNLPVDLQLKLFDHTILPILTYSCEVWGYENLDCIENIHCDFLRKITKSRKSTPRYMLYAELGRHPIEIEIKTRMIKYWNKLLLDKNTKLSHISLLAMTNDRHEFKWVKHIKSILDQTGNSNLWINCRNITTRTIDKQVKKTLIDQFQQRWQSALRESSKGTMYSSFKDNINLEPYLLNLPQSLRIPLYHFRTGNHKFPIEVGRWGQSLVPYIERKCPLCTTNELGSEFHYLLVCPHFRDTRVKHIQPYYLNKPDFNKFKILMTTTSETRLHKLASFVKHIVNFFSKRPR